MLPQILLPSLASLEGEPRDVQAEACRCHELQRIFAPALDASMSRNANHTNQLTRLSVFQHQSHSFHIHTTAFFCYFRYPPHRRH